MNDDMKAILQAVADLNRAFRERNPLALSALFTAGYEPQFFASEATEIATDRGSLEAFAVYILGRNEWYSLDENPDVLLLGDAACVARNGKIEVHGFDGDVQAFPYRYTGVLVRSRAGWQWVQFHGSEPAA